MSNVMVNGEPWGEIRKYIYLPLHVSAGKAEVNGQKINLAFSTNGAMIAYNTETQKSFTLDWQEFLELAIAVGINKTDERTEERSNT